MRNESYFMLADSGLESSSVYNAIRNMQHGMLEACRYCHCQ